MELATTPTSGITSLVDVTTYHPLAAAAAGKAGASGAARNEWPLSPSEKETIGRVEKPTPLASAIPAFRNERKRQKINVIKKRTAERPGETRERIGIRESGKIMK